MNFRKLFWKRAVLSVAMAVVSSVAGIAEGSDAFFRVGPITGTCQITRPGADKPEKAIEDKMYPYGSHLHTTANSDVVLVFRGNAQVKVGPLSLVTVQQSSMDEKTSELLLGQGSLRASSLSDVATPLRLVTPSAIFSNITGRLDIQLVRLADTHQMTATVLQGESFIFGPQFSIERIRRGSIVEIISAFDESYTSILNKAGDYEIKIEKGADEPMSVASRFGTQVKIWRRRAAITDRLAVSTMVFMSNGDEYSFSYLQGDAVVGEVTKIKESETETGGESDGMFMGDAAPVRQNGYAQSTVIDETPVSFESETSMESATFSSEIWDF